MIHLTLYAAGSTVRCGEVLRGTVRIDSPIDADGVVVSIGWHTEGRGDRDEGVVHEEVLHRGPVAPGDGWPFAARIPEEGPISYDGHSIRVVWSVVVELDRAAGRSGPEARAGLTVLPAGPVRP